MIQCLFFAGSPTTVGWMTKLAAFLAMAAPIATVVVFTINRQLLGALAHVVKEALKTLPALTNSNAAPAITGKLCRLRIHRSLSHSGPNIPCSSLARAGSARHAVFRIGLAGLIAHVTPATLRNALIERGCYCFNFIPALASATPNISSVYAFPKSSLSGKLDNLQPSKLSSGQIFKIKVSWFRVGFSHFGSFLTVLIRAVGEFALVSGPFFYIAKQGDAQWL